MCLLNIIDIEALFVITSFLENLPSGGISVQEQQRLYLSHQQQIGSEK